jgi:ferric-dicitrate binding protein FerR (iron transport regulator)
MSREPSLRRMLAPMTERQVDLGHAAFHVDRERVLARMAQAGRRDRGRRLGWVVMCAAAAAAVVLVFGTRLLKRDDGSGSSLDVVVSEGSATQVRGAAQTAVPAKRSMRIAAIGDLETAADSDARVTTADGTQIELRSHTRVSLEQLKPSTRKVRLLGGSIRCSIPHRVAEQAFQVVTPDVTVVDIGTVFTVTLEGPNLATHISVEEGEVLIQNASGQTRLHAPSTWSSAPPAVSEPPAAAGIPERATSTPNPAPVQSAKEGRPAARVPSGKAAPAATLAIESQLLRQGLAAERQGRTADAISALTQLVTEYPHSPLAPDARAALARIEAGLR